MHLGDTDLFGNLRLGHILKEPHHDDIALTLAELSQERFQ